MFTGTSVDSAKVYQKPHYIGDFGCTDAKTVVTPLDLNTKLSSTSGELFENPTLYRPLVEKLNFLTHTRPDICFAMQHLSQFMQTPRIPQFQVALHVVKYLKRSPSLVIILHNDPATDLLAYCDSD